QDMLATPVRANNVSGLLFAFIALSLLAHGSILLLSNEQVSQAPAQRLGTTFISTLLVAENNTMAENNTVLENITAVENNSPAPTLPQQSANKPQQEKPITTHTIISTMKSDFIIEPKTTLLEPKASHTQQANNVLQSPKANEAAVTPEKIITSENPSVTPQKQRNYLLGELQNRLSQYLTYPQRARRRGWQGDVIVELHINEKGQLGRVHLARSSGYSVLDRSALNAIRKLKAIDIPDNFGPLQAVNLQLPVYFRLQES
ncbi:MAG: energy transducer TonB, partial [Ectothiorhodospiraceae bacterium]|nr:energy transducer TonB [Ectothiorhodospiraceae bacterium]